MLKNLLFYDIILKRNNKFMGNKSRKIKKSAKKLIKKRNRIYTILLIVFLSLFIYSGYEMIVWLVDNDNTSKQIEYIYNSVEVVEKEDGENTIVVEQEEEIDSFNYYWDYITAKYIDVDISTLQSINDDTVAWLKVEGTNINYPVVQYTDNDYYLTKSFDKSTNSAGWIFADYRNSADLNDRNLIIYGHGRINSVMFGTLKNIMTSDWFDDPDNYLVKLSTETENTVWQVFSVYVVDYTTDYLKVNFDNDDDFKEFADMLLDRSIHDFDTSISASDNIITLSSCYSADNERVVLHAKLIKVDKKE